MHDAGGLSNAPPRYPAEARAYTGMMEGWKRGTNRLVRTRLTSRYWLRLLLPAIPASVGPKRRPESEDVAPVLLASHAIRPALTMSRVEQSVERACWAGSEAERIGAGQSANEWPHNCPRRSNRRLCNRGAQKSPRIRRLECFTDWWLWVDEPVRSRSSPSP